MNAEWIGYWYRLLTVLVLVLVMAAMVIMTINACKFHCVVLNRNGIEQELDLLACTLVSVRVLRHSLIMTIAAAAAATTAADVLKKKKKKLSNKYLNSNKESKTRVTSK